VTWTLENAAVGSGTVTLTVKVLEGALKANGGEGKVVNGGDTATVKVGDDPEIKLNTVENPVAGKKETAPYEGTGVLGPVKVGQEITYEIEYNNYKETATTVVVTDKLDKNAEFVSAEPEGKYAYNKDEHTVTWTLENAAVGSGTVTLTVKVLEGALKANGGEGKVVNGGDTASVKVGDDPEIKLNTVENLIPEKKEIIPYEGTGILGSVAVGDEITYEIEYYNYKDETATVTITDKLDKNVEFVDATPIASAEYDETTRTATWTIENAPAGADSVTLTVKVL
jgi:uncharacterized repeat protein (TIGR01451 family)